MTSVVVDPRLRELGILAQKEPTSQSDAVNVEFASECKEQCDCSCPDTDNQCYPQG